LHTFSEKQTAYYSVRIGYQNGKDHKVLAG
jgi:hypothetical protein